MADAGADLAQGLDRPEGGGRGANRRNVSRPPGAARSAPVQAGTCEDARNVDEKLSTGGALRRLRTAHRRAAGTGAERHATDGRESPRQWRPVVEGSAHARFSGLRGSGGKAGDNG